MSAGQLLIVGLACLAAGGIGALLLWLEGRYQTWLDEDRDAFDAFMRGPRP